MVVVPLLVVLYDRAYVFESFQQALRARARLYAGLAAGWLLLAALVLSDARSNTAGFANEYAVGPWTYLLNQAAIITTYLGRVVWPRHLVVNYGFPHLLTLSDVAPYVTLLVLLLLLTLFALVKKPHVGFLGAWFFLTLAPTSSLLPIATEVGAERRMYLPLMAVVILAVTAGDALRKSARHAAPVVLVIVVTALGVRTALRNRDYASSVSLFRTAVEGWPEGSTQYLLGKSLLLSGSRAEGLEHLRTAATTAPRAHYDLGVELAADGKLDEAAAHLTTLLSIAESSTTQHPVWDPPTADDVVAAHRLLGDICFAQRRYEEAIAHYRSYLESHDRDADALNHLGIALAVTGKTDDAIATFRLAVNANDANGWAMRNLANALLDRDQIAEATTYARRAVAASPEDAAAHDVLGRALGQQGRLDDAVSEFQRALQISPTFADAREHLGQAQRAQHRTP
jgi:tetratricopeptide (TPR) repeat protein